MKESVGFPDTNVRSPRYQLALTVARCPVCGSPTAVVGLVVPPGHETLDPEDDPPVGSSKGGGNASALWSVAHHHAFLFHVEFLPVAIQATVRQFVPAYGRAEADADTDDGSAGGPCGWANHCERCGALLDDQELFCEPEGAFLPTNEARAAAIHLVGIDAPFEAAAGGYAHEPQFFGAMTGSRNAPTGS
jgi:hypothetical protein